MLILNFAVDEWMLTAELSVTFGLHLSLYNKIKTLMHITPPVAVGRRSISVFSLSINSLFFIFFPLTILAYLMVFGSFSYELSQIF